MTAGQLNRLFADFNGRYFGGRLRRYRLRFGVRRMKGSATPPLGYCESPLLQITIHPKLAGDTARLIEVLLHEMAHAATAAEAPSHGIGFRKEMLRLRRRGAPVDRNDAPIEDDFPPDAIIEIRLTKKYVRAMADDALVTVPDATLVGLARWFAHEELGVSIRSMQRRYPWIRPVLSEARKAHREMLMWDRLREEDPAKFQRQLAKLTAAFRKGRR